jgi:ABC-type uncharacterized transport system ATPase subunit
MAETPLLQITDLHIDGQTGPNWLPIVRGIDLTLRPGEVLGLIGESGAGFDQYLVVHLVTRICYLANNDCHILSELENDPVGYLKYAEIIDTDNIVEYVKQSLKNDAWKEKGIAASKAFQEFGMNLIMENILDLTFT